MKTLRNIAFIMTAVVAVALSSCDGGTNPPVVDEDETPFEIHYDGKVITKDTTVSVSKLTEAIGGGYEIIFDCYIVNTTEKEHDYTITEERQFDLEKYTTMGCVEQCLPGNGEKTQVWEVGTLVAEEDQSFQGHFVISKDVESEYGTFTTVYSFSDGTNVVKVTVDFVYEKK